jgi:hypothetical protein
MTIRNALIALGMTVALVLLASALSWGYYSQGLSHYAAVVVASPFFVAAKVSTGNVATVLAFTIYFVFCFALVTLVSKAVKSWHQRQ